jgi:threonine dehydrogenase-like Zn-dependent dehydrogenase
VNAFVLTESGAELRSDWPRPTARPGWARVRTRVAGICNTDLELMRGYMGFRGVLGHEFVGVALDGAFAGARVVGGINFACGVCDECRHGSERHCPRRQVLGILGADGVFAEEFMIPERNLLPVPRKVSDHAAVFAEPVAAACEILEQLGAYEVGPALVLGDGKLGVLVAQVLAGAGFEVTLVGHHVARLGWLEKRGVTLVPARNEVLRYSLVVEATGSAGGFADALAATKPRGTVVLKTTIASRHEVDLAPIVINEIRVLGSRCGPFGPALERLAEGAVSVEELVDGVFPLDRMDHAVRRASEKGVRKILVESDRESA